MDGLKAINVYVIATDDGLVLVDGGWAIPEARELLDRCLRSIGSGFGDIRRFLVTHIHRDHFTMATVLGPRARRRRRARHRREAGARPVPPRVRDITENPFARMLRTAGAAELAERLEPGRRRRRGARTCRLWQYPDTWLDGDFPIPVGCAHPRRRAHARATRRATTSSPTGPTGCCSPATTCCPTITPSIGFTVPPTPQPLGDFMASLTKVRGLPDLKILPAHGPVAPSSHARVDELLVFHEHRLDLCLAALAGGPHNRPDGRPPARLDPARARRTTTSTCSAQGMAAMETKAHLELLVARGVAVRSEDADGVVTFAAAG